MKIKIDSGNLGCQDVDMDASEVKGKTMLVIYISTMLIICILTICFALFSNLVFISSDIANLFPISFIDDFGIYVLLFSILILFEAIFLDAGRNSLSFAFFNTLMLLIYWVVTFAMIPPYFSGEENDIKRIETLIYENLNKEQQKAFDKQRDLYESDKGDFKGSINRASFLCKKYKYNHLCEDYLNYLIEINQERADYLINKHKESRKEKENQEKSSDDFFNKFIKEK
ncbi:hypothetical protein DMB95_09385 [Campylobacter sp. MIT 12-8780]|uniref:hypothetical protein n=1 Tax=unclassified Campylobacter TaxID=2593542 RepID=UPI0010F60122|nr:MULTISPECIES: hypothetical protein [unclassified Campylobacter]NDJ28183.1 hypothetical protein [Campylobacter sp. MIT 19-121]TKX28261.1 hypothetical protein CQA38_08415 [Campylobacter sp. MIT 12-5580]TQR39991.1 hypothetical protein DMB95_09385 [Campylobacter sp. MIT 12-8780]